MDLLSWFLLIWGLVSAAVVFIVHHILPLFVSPVDSDEQWIKKETLENWDQVEKIGVSNEPGQHLEQPLAAISSWAASNLGVHVGETCDWVNDLLVWLHNRVRHSPDLENAWLRSMNDASSKVAPPLGCDVYFEEVKGEIGDIQGGPRLKSIRSEFGPREHLTMRANLNYPEFRVRIVASQKLPDQLLVSNFTAVLRNLSGQAHVRMACIGDDIFFMGCFEGSPEVEITLEHGDETLSGRVDTELVKEVIKRCLASAVTNVSLARLKEQQLANKTAVNGNSTVLISQMDVKHCQAISLQDRQRSNRLLLKVEKAERLGGGKSPSQPYVIVELDDPAQKHTTTLGFKSHPAWDEQFLFTLNDKSEEILFEVYDRPSQSLGVAPMADEDEQRFLGLAIVGIEELRHAESTNHTLTLQARPYTDDLVSGTLTAEFIFLREQFTDTRSGNRSARIDMKEQEIRPLHVVTDFRPAIGGMNTAMDSPYIDGAVEEEPERKRPLARIRGTSSYGSAVTGVSKRAPSPSTMSMDRARKKERSFFDDLKDRLTFRKSGSTKRAHSLEAEINGDRVHKEPYTLLAQPSIGQQGRSASMPAWDKNPSGTKKRGHDHTPLTSDSEMSVTSSDSVFPQSQLVVESMEGNAKKYYYLPASVQRHTIGKRLMKTGQKLHVHNEHTFTAVKMKAGCSSGSTCSVCNGAISSTFRRKAYQCRDCGLICHKRCHFKTNERCPFSKVSTLPVEIVKIN